MIMQNNDCEKALKFLFSTTLSAPYARFRIEMKEALFFIHMYKLT